MTQIPEDEEFYDSDADYTRTDALCTIIQVEGPVARSEGFMWYISMRLMIPE